MQLDSDKEKTEETELKTEDKMSTKHPDFLRPERLEGESDLNYRIRRKMNKVYLKLKKQGQPFWLAKDGKGKGFTYNKGKVNDAIDKYLKNLKEKQDEIDSANATKEMILNTESTEVKIENTENK